ncbi:MAG: cytochrome P450, partial [Dehalococcoidia bacterium]
LLAAMARAGAAEERLELPELLALVIDLSLAGNDNTSNLVGNAFLALVAHPDQQGLLREHPELVPGAIEETLRYDSPQQAAVRIVSREARLGGERLHPGQVVITMLGAANRDPEAFPDPDQFKVTREPTHRHLAFGLGPHFCIGAPIARMAGEAAVRALLQRFEVLRLAGGAPLVAVPRSADWMTRSGRVIAVDTTALAD